MALGVALAAGLGVSLVACGASGSSPAGLGEGGLESGPAVEAPSDEVQPGDTGDTGNEPPGDSSAPLPTPIAVYRRGTATISTGGATISLDQLGPDATLQTDIGSHAVWFNAAGWYLTVDGPDLSQPASPGASIDPADLAADVRLDRIVDGHHWSAIGSENCDSVVEQADATALRGSAQCRGLAWSDILLAPAPLDPDAAPSTVPGQPPFDVQITFDAR